MIATELSTLFDLMKMWLLIKRNKFKMKKVWFLLEIIVKHLKFLISMKELKKNMTLTIRVKHVSELLGT